MLSRNNLVDEYLVRNLEHLDFVIEQVVNLLPLSYFYKEAVRDSYYSAFRSEIESLRRKSVSIAYRTDRSVEQKYKREVKRYSRELEEYAEINKQSFLDWLLDEPDEMKVTCLYNLIVEYRLLKKLRTFNND